MDYTPKFLTTSIPAAPKTVTPNVNPTSPTAYQTPTGYTPKFLSSLRANVTNPDATAPAPAPAPAPQPTSFLDKAKGAVVTAGKFVGNILTGSSQAFGNTLGTAVSTFDPQTIANRQAVLDQAKQQANNYVTLATQTADKAKKTALLKAASKSADTTGVDIYNNPEYQKTAKQIYGEALGTALETLGFGELGGAAKTAEAVVKGTKAINLGTDIAKSAAIGGGFGVVSGVSGGMQENKDAKGIALDALNQGAVGVILGGVLGLAGGLISKSIANKVDGKIKYNIGEDLGVDANGKKILNHTEINPETGEAVVTIDKSVDAKTAAEIIKNENAKIIEHRTATPETKTALEHQVDDYAAKTNLSKEQIAAKIEAEVKKVGGYEKAVEMKNNNPEKAAKVMPTFVGSSTNEANGKVTRVVTAEQLRTDIEALKTPKIEATEGTRVAKGASDLEAEAIKKGLIKDIIPDKAMVSSRTVSDQAERIGEYLKTTPIESIIAGKAEIPIEIEKSMLYNAVKKLALERGDINLIHELGGSNLAKTSSELGTGLRFAQEGKGEDVVETIRKLNRDLRSDIKKKTGTGVSKLENKEKLSAKAEIQKAKASVKKIKTLTDFIESIKCPK
jgi:hypothetical protein